MTSPQQPNPYSKDPQGPSPYSSEPQHSSPYSQQYPAPQQPQAPQYPTPTPANFQSEPPLWAPWYGIGFRDAVKRVFKKYATFSGRASRGEYWWWILVCVIVTVVLNVIITAGMTTGTSTTYSGYSHATPVPGPVSILGYILALVWGLAIIVPSLAVAVRRLHDANFSGWMYLLGLIPLAGSIIILVFTLLPSRPEGQRFDRPTAPAPAYKA